MGLADPRRSDEEEDADRPVGILQPGPCPENRPRELFDRLLLADDAAAQVAVQRAEACRLAARNALGRNPRHGRQHLLDAAGVDLDGVRLQLPAPGRTVGVELRTELQLTHPRCGRLVVDRRLDRLAPLALNVGEGRGQLAQGVRFVGRPHADPRTGLVQQVDRLVREVAVRDVAFGQLDAGLERLLGVTDVVVPLVVRGDAAQDLQRLGPRGGLDHDALEPPLERGIAFDILAVLVEGRGADRLQFAAREGRFENVGRIERPLRRTGPHDRVDFVDEEDRIVGPPELLHELLHPLLELAAELRAGDERRDVEREEPLVADRVGDAPLGDAQRQPLDDGRLADARFADQDRVVLLAAREDLDDPFDLAFAAHDGVDAPLARLGGQVGAELVEQLRRRTGRAARDVVAEVEQVDLDFAPLQIVVSDAGQLIENRLCGDAAVGEEVRGGGRRIAQYFEQRMGRRDAGGIVVTGA